MESWATKVLSVSGKKSLGKNMKIWFYKYAWLTHLYILHNKCIDAAARPGQTIESSAWILSAKWGWAVWKPPHPPKTGQPIVTASTTTGKLWSTNLEKSLRSLNNVSIIYRIQTLFDVYCLHTLKYFSTWQFHLIETNEDFEYRSGIEWIWWGHY